MLGLFLDRASFKVLGLVVLLCVSLAQTTPWNVAQDSEENYINLARVEYQNGYQFGAQDSKENSNLARVKYQNELDSWDFEENSDLAKVEYQNGFDAQDSDESSNLARIEYQNRFDKLLSKTCYGLQGMYKVASVHSNHHEDRAWTWECRNVVSSGSVSGCSSSGYANYWDLPMNFMCPANQYIAGVKSYHSNSREDRRWKFTCCSISNHITVSCRQTDYVNNWDAPLNFQANKGEVITGVFSYHDNKRE